MRGVDETTPGDLKDASSCRAKPDRVIVVHGSLVQVSGLGVLIMGDSGIGKTACGLDLIGRGGVWIADDAVVLERRGDALYGRGHERTKKLIAVRGRGILDTRSLLSAENLIEETQVHIIIQFIRRSHEQGMMTGSESGSLLHVEGIPVLCRRIAAGGDSAQMADEVIGCINEYLARGMRGSTGKNNEEADASGNHYGTVRFR